MALKTLYKDGKPLTLSGKVLNVDVGGGTTTKEVALTVAVKAGAETVIDSGAAEQTVALAWNIPASKIIPAFTNYFIARSGITYPRELTSRYNQIAHEQLIAPEFFELLKRMMIYA